MADEFDEHLGSRLEGLSAGVAHARLPGATAARKRGARRTRRQVGGALTAAVVVAAGLAGVAGVGPFADPEPAPPAAASSPAKPTEPTGSAADQTVARAPAIPPDALMTADDIDGDGEWTRATGRTDDGGTVTSCEPDARARAMRGSASVTFTAGTGLRVRQDLIRVGSSDASGTTLDALRKTTLSCLPQQSSGADPRIVNEGELSGVGDEAWLVQYYVDPADPDAPAVTLALVRYDDAFSTTIDVEPTGNTTGDVDVATPAAAAERMCAVMFDADCVEEPAFEDGVEADPLPTSDPTGEQDSDRTDEPDADPSGDAAEPLLDLADDPLLTTEDVGPVGTYDGFGATSRQPPPPDDETCLADLGDVGADAQARGRWSQELGEGIVAEYVLRMPDLEGARRLITDHTVLPEQCGEVADTHEQTVGEPAYAEVEGADDALIWTVDDRPLPSDPGSEGAFTGVGMARAGNVVVILTFGASGDPTDGGWADYAARTLSLAVQRAVP